MKSDIQIAQEAQMLPITKIAEKINLSEDDFVFTADQFSYMYTDAVGNYEVSDVCDEDSGIVRYSLYLERGPEISIDGDLKNITLAALAVEKN